MHRARSMGTPDKRLKNFSQVLCIPINFFQKITTHDFDQLKICKEEFEQSTNIKAALEYVPEWKQKLIFNITNYLHCPIHIAKEVARVDKLNWQIHSNDILNDSVKILVDWVSKTAKKQKQTALSIE